MAEKTTTPTQTRNAAPPGNQPQEQPDQAEVDRLAAEAKAHADGIDAFALPGQTPAEHAATTAQAALANDTPRPSSPTVVKVELTAPYGFYEEGGSPRFWAVGAVVTDPIEIELMLQRSAPLIVTTEDD